jgi:chemotaxis methyl-accepting protein methylase
MPQPGDTDFGGGQPYVPALMLDQMTDRHFRELARILEGHTGIRLPESKRTMVESRLRKRLRALGLASLDEYCGLILDRGHLEHELVHVIDCVTTNKTDFFREPDHFVILQERVLPRLLGDRKFKNERFVKVWSAACSIGAEVYTLAMVLDDLSEPLEFKYSLLGTDISTVVLEQAVKAVYPAVMMDPIPPLLRKRYVMMATNPKQDTARIVPELRCRARFQRLNLMDQSYPVDSDVDVVFCRNILIYFARQTQDQILERLCSHLRPGGFLFVGHAESLTGAERFGMRQFAPTIFVRQ